LSLGLRFSPNHLYSSVKILRRHGRLLIAALLLACGWARLSLVPVLAQDSNVGQLLDLANLAEPKEALTHLTSVVRMLAAEQMVPRSQRRELAERLAQTLNRRIRTQEDIVLIFGQETGKSVSRQVLYRRYLECWTYDEPLGIRVVFDCPKGLDPVVIAVHAYGL
jgi:hypothetical protein